MNNLYTPRRRKEVIPPLNSYTIYLQSLSSNDPHLKLITTISYENKKLYVLYADGYYYLSDMFVLDEGIANILYSSANRKRLIGYGEQLLKQQISC